MAFRSNETLKTYYETSDVPTSAEFSDFIISKVGILATTGDLPTAAATNVGEKYLIGTTLYTSTLDTQTSTYSWVGQAWGGGVTAYGDLTSKPQINSIELVGNKTATQFQLLGTELTGITALGAFADTDLVYVRRGSTWYYGTYANMKAGMIDAIPVYFSGTDITTQGSGIVVTVTGSKVGDLYINTSTGDLYQCVATNTWDWIIELKGADGEDGASGAEIGAWESTVTTLADSDYITCFSNGAASKITVANLKTVINAS